MPSRKAWARLFVDDNNYMKGYGEYLPHHNLTVAGTVNFPWGLVLSLNSSIIKPHAPNCLGQRSLPARLPFRINQ